MKFRIYPDNTGRIQDGNWKRIYRLQIRMWLVWHTLRTSGDLKDLHNVLQILNVKIEVYKV